MNKEIKAVLRKSEQYLFLKLKKLVYEQSINIKLKLTLFKCCVFYVFYVKLDTQLAN